MKKVLAIALFFAGCAQEVPHDAQVIVHRERVVEYRTAPASKEFWYKLIDYYADQFDVDRVVARTVFFLESSEAVNTYAYNKHKLKAAKKLTGDKLEQDMLASALCPFQVLGLTAKEFDVDWESLAFDPVECVRTGVYYLRKLSDRHARLSKSERRKAILFDYYGHDANGVKYSQKGMALIARAEQPRKKQGG